MLDLNTWIDFNEVKFVCISIDKELNRSGIFVIGSLPNRYCSGTYLIPYRWRNIRCWSHLNNFLMPSLNRAVSLVKVDKISVCISEKLYFDMSGVFDKLFNKDACTSKSSFTLTLSALQCSRQVFSASYNSHASTATTMSCLEHDRESKFLSSFYRLFKAF